MYRYTTHCKLCICTYGTRKNHLQKKHISPRPRRIGPSQLTIFNAIEQDQHKHAGRRVVKMQSALPPGEAHMSRTHEPGAGCSTWATTALGRFCSMPRPGRRPWQGSRQNTRCVMCTPTPLGCLNMSCLEKPARPLPVRSRGGSDALPACAAALGKAEASTHVGFPCRKNFGSRTG